MIHGSDYDVIGGVPFTKYEGLDDSKLYLVNTPEEWQAFYAELNKQKIVACDTETTGFRFYAGDKIVGMSFGWKDTHFYVPVRHDYSETGGVQPSQLTMESLRDDLVKFFSRQDVFTLFHHAKFDFHFYRVDGIEIKTPFHDTRILWQLYDENAPGALKTIASGWTDDMGRRQEGLIGPEANAKEKELSAWRGDEAKRRRDLFRKEVMDLADELQTHIEHQDKSRIQLKQWITETLLADHPYRNAAKNDIHYGCVPIELMVEYAAIDTFLTYRLYEHVIQNLQMGDKLRQLYVNELKLSRSLMEAEERGVKVDRPYLEKLGTDLDKEMEELERSIKMSLGDESLNVASNQQLANAFIANGIELTKTTDKGNYVLDVKVLSKLEKEHKVVKDLLDLRKLVKIRGTYVTGILDKLTPDDILHCSFNQNVSTGRMCIAKGTAVQTPCDRSRHPNGVPIEEVKVGDQVYCYDSDGNLHLRKVLWAGQRGVKETVVVRWVGQGNQHEGTLVCTPDHPIRLFDGTWVEAQHLQENDRVMALSSRLKGPAHDKQVGYYRAKELLAYYSLEQNHRILCVEKGPTVPVYDLEVSEFNNFIAGELCVHNSSRDPNLQNIPGRDDRIRKAFICPEDYVYILADYSQVEVRLTAHYSQDPLLLDSYAKGQDVHTRTMCEMFGYDYEVVQEVLGDNESSHELKKLWKELRTIAKRINFGIIYGVGAPGLSEQIPRPEQYKDLSEKEWIDVCQSYINEYFRKYFGVKRFINRCDREVRKNGFVVNHFGRVRHLPHAKADKLIGQDQFWRVGRAQRQGANFLIQGCQDPAAPVLTEFGYIPIKDLESHGKPSLVTFSGVEEDYAVLDTGDKECVEVETTVSTGICSAEHKFFVYDSAIKDLVFRGVDELTVGDVVCADFSRVVPGTNNREVSLAEAELLGVLIGDGYYAHTRSALSICVSDKYPEYRDRLIYLWKTAFPDCTVRIDQKKNKSSVVVERKDIRDRFLFLGLDRVTREAKRVPDWVLTHTVPVRTAVLRGLLDTDGGINGRTIGFTNKSENVARTVQLLLASLGVGSRFDKTKAGYFRVVIPMPHLAKVADLMSVKHKIDHAKKSYSLYGQTHRDYVPEDLVSDVCELLLSQRSSLQLTESELVMLYRGRISKSRAERLLGQLPGSPAVQNLLELVQLDWARIERVTPAGVRPTMDLELHGKDHSYICRGLVQHNTAADVFKIAVVRVHELLESTKSFMVSFVHDEIQAYIHKDELHLLNAMKRLMEDFDFSVPITADFAYTKTSWGEKKEL